MNADIHALSGAYAVDAVSDEERVAFEAHLAECDSCRAEVDELRNVATLLSEAAPIAPPPALRDSLLAQIDNVRPLPPVPAQAPAPAPDEAAPAPIAELPTRSRRWFPALVAAVLILVVGGVIWRPWTQEQPPSEAQQIIAAADVSREVTMATDQNATVTIYRAADLGKAVLVADNLPQLPDDKAYAAWLQSPDGDMVPAGILSHDSDQTLVLEGDASHAVGAGLTVEPASGSPVPTSDPVALIDLTNQT